MIMDNWSEIVISVENKYHALDAAMDIAKYVHNMHKSKNVLYSLFGDRVNVTVIQPSLLSYKMDDQGMAFICLSTCWFIVYNEKINKSYLYFVLCPVVIFEAVACHI